MTDDFFDKASDVLSDEGNDRELRNLEKIAEFLWTGNFLGQHPQPQRSTRFEMLLITAKDIRFWYQWEAYEVIGDWTRERDLTDKEAGMIHNSWMNGVQDWMNDECKREYDELLREAAMFHEQSGKGKKGTGAGQRAQNLKKTRFNKVISDLAYKKNHIHGIRPLPGKTPNTRRREEVTPAARHHVGRRRVRPKWSLIHRREVI